MFPLYCEKLLVLKKLNEQTAIVVNNKLGISPYISNTTCLNNNKDEGLVYSKGLWHSTFYGLFIFVVCVQWGNLGIFWPKQLTKWPSIEYLCLVFLPVSGL